MENAGRTPVIDLTEKIHAARGLRVMLDSDLATIYGVSLKRLREQVRRNPKRFPPDFAFVVTPKELRNLMPQNAASRSKRHGGSRALPIVFTEFGAIMVANVLKSEQATEMSVFVVRAFVRMREMLANNAALSEKLTELETRVSGHDSAIAEIISAIRQLVSSETEKPKREIGFHIKDSANKSC